MRVCPEPRLDHGGFMSELAQADRRRWYLGHAANRLHRVQDDWERAAEVLFVSQIDEYGRAPHRRYRVVGDPRGKHVTVRHEHQPAVVGPDLRGPQLDLLDRALCVADDDLVPERER